MTRRSRALIVMAAGLSGGHTVWPIYRASDPPKVRMSTDADRERLTKAQRRRQRRAARQIHEQRLREARK